MKILRFGRRCHVFPYFVLTRSEDFEFDFVLFRANQRIPSEKASTAVSLTQLERIRDPRESHFRWSGATTNQQYGGIIYVTQARDNREFVSRIGAYFLSCEAETMSPRAPRVGHIYFRAPV